MTTTHILRTSTGPIVTGTFDEATASLVCEWEPWPLTSQEVERLLPEYERWRNAIFQEWADRTGQNALIITT